jgi:hypothetical protein
MAVYWGCHQRFFKQLIVSLKVGKKKLTSKQSQTLKVSVIVTGKHKTQ